jgi:hypothetical protein
MLNYELIIEKQHKQSLMATVKTKGGYLAAIEPYTGSPIAAIWAIWEDDNPQAVKSMKKAYGMPEILDWLGWIDDELFCECHNA